MRDLAAPASALESPPRVWCPDRAALSISPIVHWLRRTVSYFNLSDRIAEVALCRWRRGADLQGESQAGRWNHVCTVLRLVCFI